ncbi:MAG: M20/M25/M40 family metallo-hydrolase [Bacillota bacterium]
MIALTAVGLIAAAAVTWLSRPVTQPYLSATLLQFETERAYANIEELCLSYPERSIFHPDNREAAAWLKNRLAALGLETGTQEFNSWAGDKPAENLLNVYGISRGTVKPEEMIVITSHFDIPAFVYQGAADAGSDIGIILELARIFASEEHNRTILFLFTNNEEYGMQGARNFIEQFADMEQVKAVLSMDYMNMGEMNYILARFMGLQKGYTPLWLRELTLAAAGAESPVRSTDPFMEWVDRSVTIASTDAGMFLRAGYPTVNITTRAIDLERQRLLYHSREDTVEKLEPATITAYGRAAERILRGLDEIPVLPAGEMSYFKYGHQYLPGWVITFLQLLLFAPFFAVLAVDFRLAAPAALGASRREIVRAGLLFAAGTAGYLLLRLLPLTGAMVRYPLYPATQKDPVLYHPQYLPAVLVLLTVLLTGLVLFKVVYPRLTAMPQNQEAAEAGRRWVLLLLAVLVLVIWAEGSGFAAVTFFLLPAYLWIWIKPASRLPRRILNLALAVLGGAVFFAFIYIFTTTYQIGVTWWYILLAAACGLFSYKVVLVFLAAAALLITMSGIAARRR